MLKDPNDQTRMRLLFANQSEQDMLLGEELDQWAAEDSRFEVHHILSRASAAWKGSRGRCSEQLFKDHLHPHTGKTLALLCGPQPMLDQCCIPLLQGLGFGKEQIVVF